jgi:Domain of unknown function (DUF4247)
VSTRGKLILACGLGLAGVLVIVSAVVRTHDVRRYLRGHYGVVSSSGNSLVLGTPQSPRLVYDDLARNVRPADTVVDGSGYFLRYRGDIVAITGDTNGSRIYVDDEQRGYAVWFPYVGGHWGTFSGRGESFRGGGPGSGK